MASTIRLKRSSTPGKVPLTTDLVLGEVAVNTFDGKLYTKRDNGTESIVKVGATSITVSDTAPAAPEPSDLWYDSTSGKTYVYYNDGTSSQWVLQSDPVNIGPQGAQGVTGPQGPQGYQGYQGYQGFLGNTGVIASATAPTNTEVLWLDESDPNGVGIVGIPAGGNTGYALVKTTNNNYDVAWGIPGLFVRTVSSSNTLLTTDSVVIADSATPITLTLPSASNTRVYYIKNKGTGAVTLSPINSELIDGASSLVLSYQWSAVSLTATGTEWVIL